MSDSYSEQHRKKLLRSCEEYSEFGPCDDGYQYFWIENRGCLSAEDLRIIADELDRRNKDWDEQLSEYFKNSSIEDLNKSMGDI